MLITTSDDRSLQVLDAGGDGLPCVFHNGTPGGPVVYDAAVRAANDVGLRWITYGRPGYGESTPFPDRPVVQAARDTATVLDHLGLDAFVTYGWSGGGPHALACAAVLPGRCLAAASIAGVAPFDASGLDFTAGMGPGNVEEFGLAAQGRAALTPWLLEHAPAMRETTADDIAQNLDGLLGEVDRAVLTGELAEFLAASVHESLKVGITGWLDDDLAFTSPWGFAVESITVPVAIWQGEHDLMVPFAHGQWLALHVPGARVHLLPDHGHLSVGVGNLPSILAELRDLAGAVPSEG